jgi:hypothetical protein
MKRSKLYFKIMVLVIPLIIFTASFLIIYPEKLNQILTFGVTRGIHMDDRPINTVCASEIAVLDAFALYRIYLAMNMGIEAKTFAVGDWIPAAGEWYRANRSEYYNDIETGNAAVKYDIETNSNIVYCLQTGNVITVMEIMQYDSDVFNTDRIIGLVRDPAVNSRMWTITMDELEEMMSLISGISSVEELVKTMGIAEWDINIYGINAVLTRSMANGIWLFDVSNNSFFYEFERGEELREAHRAEYTEQTRERRKREPIIE